MRQVLNSEKLREMCNAAALGMFNSAISSGMTTSESNQDSETVQLSTEAQKIIDKIRKIDEKLDKIGFDTPLTYGLGTQRLGHAQKKRDGLAMEKNKLRDQLYDFGYEILPNKKINKI